MEIFTIVVSSILAVFSPGNLILDKVIENNIRSQVVDVETLKVRVDNSPSYQIFQGKAQRLRIATRGLQPIENVRIEALELETDPIDINLDLVGKNDWLSALRQPLQGGIRLVVKEDDVNEALKSDKIKAMLQDIIANLGGEDRTRNYELSKAIIDFKGDNRVELQLQLERAATPTRAAISLDIKLEVGIEVKAGRTIELIEPQGTVNERTLSRRLLAGFAEGLRESLDLRELEDTGITARVLQLDIKSDQIDLAAFIRVEDLQAPTKKD